MTDTQKLEALIQRADWFAGVDNWTITEDGGRLFVHTESEWFTNDDIGLATNVWSVEEIIFNHDFARALFGEYPPEVAYQFHSSIIRNHDNLIISGGWPKWKYHLVEAVISDNPIDYMYQAAFPTEVDQQKPGK